MAQTFADPGNVSTFLQQLQYINGLTDVGYGGMLGTVILLILGSTLFFIMKSFKTESAMGVALFITSIIGFMFRILGLVTNEVTYICIILFVYSLFKMRGEAANQEI